MIYSGSKAINVEFKDQTEVSVLLSDDLTLQFTDSDAF